MSKGFEWTFFPQTTYKWPTVIAKDAQNHWSSGKFKSKQQWDITSHLLGWILSKKKKDNKCGEIGILVNCWWECKLVQPLWKKLWKFVEKLKIELPYVSAMYIFKGIKISILKKYLHPYVHYIEHLLHVHASLFTNVKT